jgi:hypothetical protein
MKNHSVKKPWLVLALALPAYAAGAQTTGMNASTQAQPATSVAAALHNSTAYLDQQFSIDKLPQKMIDGISHVDTGKTGFKRIAVDFKEVFDKVGSAVPMTYDKSSIFVDEGHGIFKQYDVLKTNGFETVSAFILSYRGLTNLRWQTLSVNATAMPPIYQLENFTLSAPASAASFSYVYDFRGSTAVLAKNDTECKAGAVYPASQLNSEIQGTVHDVDCQILNTNGIAIGVEHYSYLDKYGIAIQTHLKTTTSEISRTVVSLKME